MLDFMAQLFSGTLFSPFFFWLPHQQWSSQKGFPFLSRVTEQLRWGSLSLSLALAAAPGNFCGFALFQHHAAGFCLAFSAVLPLFSAACRFIFTSGSKFIGGKSFQRPNLRAEDAATAKRELLHCIEPRCSSSLKVHAQPCTHLLLLTFWFSNVGHFFRRGAKRLPLYFWVLWATDYIS